MQLDFNLLHNVRERVAEPDDLNAGNVLGSYSPLRFVLRLSPEIHRRIAALPTGIITGVLDFENVQAYSTYLHETIHWWQHVGSTFGLLMSLSYPAQAHANYNHLKDLVKAIGPKKSILRLIETRSLPRSVDPMASLSLANIVVNNFFDIEYFSMLQTSSNKVKQIVGSPFFESVGHSYQITYANILLILANTLGKGQSLIPDPRGWEKPFSELEAQKISGYYRGSDVGIAPIAARELFEGQARFGQLQFLHFASGGRLNWEDFRTVGMLNDVYVAAFELFLKLAEIPWPTSIDNPSVALFMLVCDMALNPGAGFPMPIRSFRTFIEDVNPAIRFVFICRAIATKRPDVATAISHYSRSEYAQVTDALSDALQLDAPLTVAKTLDDWSQSEEFDSLMAEYRTFCFRSTDLPVRLLFSHFLAFNSDKLKNPEVFCWPGAWMAGERASPEVATLFDRHSALFRDKPDDSGVFPRIFSDKDDGMVHKAFETFYAFNVNYEMTRQWIAKTGPFEYKFQWLSASGKHEDLKAFADNNFRFSFGVEPDQFDII